MGMAEASAPMGNRTHGPARGGGWRAGAAVRDGDWGVLAGYFLVPAALISMLVHLLNPSDVGQPATSANAPSEAANTLWENRPTLFSDCPDLSQRPDVN